MRRRVRPPRDLVARVRLSLSEIARRDDGRKGYVTRARRTSLLQHRLRRIGQTGD